ncbi:MAG TPA: MarR family transcriptional regulator [Acidimicrobiia bacterium]|nr:MarR family transcriptional regulator [Acidimicrobiia bacterium]
MDLSARARAHAALGDEHRLLIADELSRSDRTTGELATLTGLPGNLLAHHLKVLERAGLVARRPSEGDRRRRYLHLLSAGHQLLGGSSLPAAGKVLFICTHNSARSQFAAACYQSRTGHPAHSAGSHPASRVHPRAVAAAAAFGIDLSGAVPLAYHQVDLAPDLVVSVCDRAAEGTIPFAAPRLHWSVPDPVNRRGPSAFRTAFADIFQWIERWPLGPQPQLEKAP